jgi:enoyl-CoA hydratase/carnithine racemase
MIDLQNRDGVYVLRMNGGENRFNWAFLDAINAALDQVERAAQPVALVTIGDGKFYSNGLDLDWMAGPGREQAGACLERVHALLGRMLTFPAITIAALNGHTFAAGAMLALGHDYRLMRSDRGYFCLPEIDIRIPFTKGMSALIQARLPKVTAHEAMTTGRRYGADDAMRASIVHETAIESAVLSSAIALGQRHAGKDPATLAAIKQVAYEDVLAALRASGAHPSFAS